jgi:hypothetical protein
MIRAMNNNIQIFHLGREFYLSWHCQYLAGFHLWNIALTFADGVGLIVFWSKNVKSLPLVGHGKSESAAMMGCCNCRQ